MRSYADDYEDFNNEAAELLEEQSPLVPKPIIVSYSEIFKYQTCPRQYYYSFILNKKPTEQSEAITTGIKGHKLLENFYRFLAEGYSKDEALALTTKSAEKLVGKGGFTDFALLKAWTLVDNYIRANDFTSKTVLIENRFLIPVSTLIGDELAFAIGLSNVQIGFTPDVAFIRNGDFIDVEDYKFVERSWSKKKLNRYQQSKLYEIFLKKMGYKVSQTILRFFHVNKDGGHVTIQKYTLTPAAEEILIRDFIAGVRDVIKFKTSPQGVHESAPRTMNYTVCQFCAFEMPCTLQAEGKSATNTLNSLFMDSDYDYTR